MDLCVDQNIAVFIGGLALINRCIAELNVGQDQCPRTHMPSGVQICPYNTHQEKQQKPLVCMEKHFLKILKDCLDKRELSVWWFCFCFCQVVAYSIWLLIRLFSNILIPW